MPQQKLMRVLLVYPLAVVRAVVRDLRRSDARRCYLRNRQVHPHLLGLVPFIPEITELVLWECSGEYPEKTIQDVDLPF